MPRRASLTLNVLLDLTRQLRYAPREAILRAIDRCESLAAQIDPQGTYPNEWIVFRVTKYRSDDAASMASVVAGRTLLSQLSAFVERLCEAAVIEDSDLPDGFVGVDDLARAWGVSRRTIDRCRREGLIARRVRVAGGRSRVVVRSAGAEAYRAAHLGRLDKARSYSRMDARSRVRIARLADRYRRRHGVSLNQAAARLAHRLGRSLETIRQVLIRAEQQRAATHRGKGQRPATGWRSRIAMTRRERRLAYRAWRRGIEPGLVGRRLGRDRQAVLRATLLERLAALASITSALGGSTSPTFERSDAARSLLGPPPAREGLGRGAERDLGRFLQAARARVVPVKAEEMARGVAYRFLIWRAGRGLGAVDRHHPSASAIDAVETDLRWASRLKAELVRAQTPLMLQILEGRLGVAFGGRRPAEIAALVAASLRSVSEAVDSFDPFRASATGASLAGSVSVAITREAARWAHREAALAPPRRATAVFTFDIPMADWTRHLNPWQEFLEPDERLRGMLGSLTTTHAHILSARNGWSGSPPATLSEVRRALGLTAMQAGMLERSAMREALAAWRLNPPG